jgi:hypothetical protein
VKKPARHGKAKVAFLVLAGFLVLFCVPIQCFDKPYSIVVTAKDSGTPFVSVYMQGGAEKFSGVIGLYLLFLQG